MKLKRKLLADLPRKRRVFAVAMFALAALGIALISPRPADEQVPLGEQQVVETAKPRVCVHTLLENEVREAKIKRSLELTRELGAATIVQFFPWAYYEPQPGQFSWDGADRIVRHAQRQGIRIIARLGLVPGWARPSSEAKPTTLNYLPPDSYEKFAHFAAAFAERYAEAIDAVIIWNEPNLSFEWGFRPVDPSAYTRLLRISYPRIKVANPTVKVLAGALAPTREKAGSRAGLNEFDYLSAMYQAGAREFFDALAMHTYGYHDAPSAEPDPERLNFRRAELLREIMLHHGDEHKPATITEFGWNDHPRWTGAVRPSQRSAYTVQAFKYAEKNWDWVDNLCLWALRYPADILNYPDNFTLISADFTLKPIYFALQNYARGWSRSEETWLPPPRAG